MSIMKRIISTLFAVLLISSAAFAQDDKKEPENKPRPVMKSTISTSIDGPKFEMISRLVGDTHPYRLNKETGEVWLFFYDKKYVIDIEESENTVIIPGENNFQLILSGDSSAYLMNIPSGEVWYLKHGGTILTSYRGSRFVLPKTAE